MASSILELWAMLGGGRRTQWILEGAACGHRRVPSFIEGPGEGMGNSKDTGKRRDKDMWYLSKHCFCGLTAQECVRQSCVSEVVHCWRTWGVVGVNHL